MDQEIREATELVIPLQYLTAIQFAVQDLHISADASTKHMEQLLTSVKTMDLIHYLFVPFILFLVPYTLDLLA